MSDLATAQSTETTSCLANFIGEAQVEITAMIGVGVVKESDAVFFQYIGDNQPPQPVTLPSGKPVTRFPNVQFAGIEVKENIGEFNATKLNLYIRNSVGEVLMLTSGLQTIWSQSIVNGLFAFVNTHACTKTFHLDTWKGTSKMRPCFSAIRIDGETLKDNLLKQQLIDLKHKGDDAGVEKMMRDMISTLQLAFGIDPVETSVVDDGPEPTADEIEKSLPATPVPDTEVPF